MGLGGVPCAAGRGRHGRHSLRDQMVQARHPLAGRLGGHDPGRDRHGRGVRGRLQRRWVHDEPAAGGCAGGAGVGGLSLRGRRPGARARGPGPIGGWFVWDGTDTAPVLLLGGGSGVVPLRAILRHHAASGSTAAMHLVYSARTPGDVIYRQELEALAGPRRAVTLTLTRESALDWAGHRGRVDAGFLSEVGWPPSVQPHCYVCGPTAFVEAVAEALVGLGHEPGRIRTERFGPTGG